MQNHAELWLSHYGHGPERLYFSQLHQGIFLYSKAWETLTNIWLEAVEDSEVKRWLWWYVVGLKLITRKPVILSAHEKMENLFYFSGSLKWMLGEVLKRKGTLQNQMQCSSGDLQRLKKSQDIFYFFPSPARGFL